MDRRTFLQSIAAAAVLPGRTHGSAPTTTTVGADPRVGPDDARSKKAVLISMLPKELPYAARFQAARDAGFDAIEMQTIARDDEAAEVRDAAKTTGLRIHSVMNMDHWRFPLSSRDPDVVSRSVAGMETSLRNAALWGADTVLLVPAVVDATTSYRDAWTRSQQVIRERLLPLARELKVSSPSRRSGTSSCSARSSSPATWTSSIRRG